MLLLLFFFLAWNEVQKMFQIEQKMFRNKLCSKMNKKCSKGNKKCSKGNNKCSWTKFVPNRTKNVTKGKKCSRLKIASNLAESSSWQNHSFMTNYRIDWTFNVFSRDHRSKFIWSCAFKCLYHGLKINKIPHTFNCVLCIILLHTGGKKYFSFSAIQDSTL